MTEEQRDAYDTFLAESAGWPTCEFCGHKMAPDQEHDCAAVEHEEMEGHYDGLPGKGWAEPEWNATLGTWEIARESDGGPF